MTIFDSFKEVEYSFLTISKGGIKGDSIIAIEPLKGVFKLRSGSQTINNMDIRLSSATLHAHPEDYPQEWSNIIGNGVEVNGVSYEITNITAGTNFNNGTTEHLTFTLQRASYLDER